jgi:hypothetical protein
LDGSFGSRDLGEAAKGWKPKRGAGAPLGLHHRPWVRVAGGNHDLILWDACLQQEDAAILTSSEQPRGAHEEPQCLLGGTVSRGEKLLIELDEHDEAHRVVGVGANPVQHRFGSDSDVEGRQRRARGIDRDDPGSRNERPKLLANADHAGTHHAESCP